MQGEWRSGEEGSCTENQGAEFHPQRSAAAW